MLRRLLAEKSVNALPPADANLLKFGLTSLDMINLVLAIEAEFDLVIPEGSIMPRNLLSISAICQLVEKLSADA